MRKTLALSQLLAMDRALATWEGLVYNLVWPLRTWRVELNTSGRCWLLRSPATTAGLTDYVWTVKELLWTVVPPSTLNRETTR
ncbi:MAG: hypothetical protein RML36_05680 [Anaerolineae bacterium]|nr:hypothetical protein [Anaerolineae bacterium]